MEVIYEFEFEILPMEAIEDHLRYLISSQDSLIEDHLRYLISSQDSLLLTEARIRNALKYE
jgi:REP element-mobilizing transposase RayT